MDLDTFDRMVRIYLQTLGPSRRKPVGKAKRKARKRSAQQAPIKRQHEG